MHSSEIRDKYLKFFEDKGHLVAPSDSLVPNDPTLLFTSAGMVQFKPYFIGEMVPPRARMSTSQKCLRTGDLDIVGTTASHHTFFEMLGNFSFGDYFKEEAITWAWEFLTEEMKISPDRLWVTVYLTDDEAADIWEKKIGLPKDRIVRLGEKSNYWPSNAPSEGPNGPCGPCSEIFIDFGVEAGCQTPECNPDCDCGRFKEIWNLVFTQYNREDGGVLTPLPQKNIDTGMGLERLVSVMQGVKTNFDTDLFIPIIEKAASIAGVKYGVDKKTDVALRVIADHSRAMAFTIADGVMPSNVGRGYVLRRIIRRAVLKAKTLGLEEMFLERLVPVVIDIMDAPYPELKERKDHIYRTIRAEEEKFRRSLDMGLQKLEEAVNKIVKTGSTEIPGIEAFVLYDTYGFPLELTQEIATERGLTVDTQGFNDAMEEQRRKAREGSDVPATLFVATLGALSEIEKSEPATDFVGYREMASQARIVGLLKEGELINSASAGEKIDIVLDKTPFYPESGGQVTDIGIISVNGSEAKVEMAARIGALIVHSCMVTSGTIKTGDEVSAEVDTNRRMSIMRNHTATHLLHKALRMMLGDHVVQAGSSVDPSRLRFDFTHSLPVTPGELEEIEKIVNDAILRDLEVQTTETTLEQAKSDGAMALFSEKYSGVVRVIKAGDFSMELCGGTHVGRSSQIGSFKIVSESSVGAGLRRIEAVTGAAALNYLRERNNLLNEIAGTLKVSPVDAPDAVNRLVENLKTAEKQISELEQKSALSAADELASNAEQIDGINLVISRMDNSDGEIMSAMADALTGKLKSGVIVLGGAANGKVVLVCKVTQDLVKQGFHAGNMIREIAKVAGGGGGGRPDFAQAGGKDVEKIDEALAKVRELIRKQVGG
ncbi:MAG: alanine--tRNA ligase [Armatimonadota bacterium]